MKWNEAAVCFTDALASSEPTPGGGAAAAHTASMGAALLQMSIQTTLKRKNITPEHVQALQTSAHRVAELKKHFDYCMTQDSQAYERYLWAKKLPKEDFSRESEIQNALEKAALVPADTAQKALLALEELEAITPFISPVILADAACAKHLLQAALCCAVENIRANTPFIKNKKLLENLSQQVQLFLKSCKEGIYDRKSK